MEIRLTETTIVKHFQSHNINYKSLKYLEKVENQHRLYHKYTDCSLKGLDMSIVLVSENPANLGKVLTSLVNCLKINTAYFVLSCLTSLYFADTVVFYKLKTCGNPASSKSVGAILPRAFYHFVSLYHILVILIIFQAFPSFSSVQFSSVQSLSHVRLFATP